jgi:hypothetical protein
VKVTHRRASSTRTPTQRRRRNHIHELECDGRLLSDEQEKAVVIFSYFDVVLGTTATRSNNINLQALELPLANLQELGGRFTEEEVWRVICSLPSDKASGLDRFTTQFM